MPEDVLERAIDLEKVANGWVDKFHGDDRLCSAYFDLYERAYRSSRGLCNALDGYFRGEDKQAMLSLLGRLAGWLLGC